MTTFLLTVVAFGGAILVFLAFYIFAAIVLKV